MCCTPPNRGLRCSDFSVCVLLSAGKKTPHTSNFLNGSLSYLSIPMPLPQVPERMLSDSSVSSKLCPKSPTSLRLDPATLGSCALSWPLVWLLYIRVKTDSLKGPGQAQLISIFRLDLVPTFSEISSSQILSNPGVSFFSQNIPERCVPFSKHDPCLTLPVTSVCYSLS